MSGQVWPPVHGMSSYNGLALRRLRRLALRFATLRSGHGSASLPTITRHLSAGACTPESLVWSTATRRCLEPPVDRWALIVWDVASMGPGEEYLKRVREWAHQVWEAWSGYHGAVASLLSRQLAPADRRRSC
jgi:hypothetical protein